MGIVLLQQGEYNEAIAALNKSVSDSPNANRHVVRGDANSAMGKIESAIADYTAATKLDPKCARAFHKRGKAYRETGATAKADTDLLQAAELDPAFTW